MRERSCLHRGLRAKAIARPKIGAPDMIVVSNKVDGRLWCLCPIEGSFAPQFRTSRLTLRMTESGGIFASATSTAKVRFWVASRPLIAGKRPCRNVGSDDAMAMLGQEYAVSPFAIGDRQDFRSWGQTMHLAHQECVGRGPEQILLRCITLIPEGRLVRFSHGPPSTRPLSRDRHPAFRSRGSQAILQPPWPASRWHTSTCNAAPDRDRDNAH